MKKQSKNKRKSPSLFKRFLGFLLLLAVVFGLLHLKYGHSLFGDNVALPSSMGISPWEQVKLNNTLHFYKADVVKNAEKYNLPPSYFLSLIVLESSGKKKPKTRFEPKIYERLKACRDGKTKSFGSIERRRLKKLSDGALKNLASSWGPFQLMGYHAFELGIYIKDIRGPESVKFGMKWIEKRYGADLRKKDYKDAFHIHNTGRPFPSNGKPFTHDPNYINKGLKYIDYFEKEL